MSFYQAMQLGAINLKPLIKETEDKKLKQKYITAFVLKNILCLLFCIFVVSSFSNIFGNIKYRIQYIIHPTTANGTLSLQRVSILSLYG